MGIFKNLKDAIKTFDEFNISIKNKKPFNVYANGKWSSAILAAYDDVSISVISTDTQKRRRIAIDKIDEIEEYDGSRLLRKEEDANNRADEYLKRKQIIEEATKEICGQNKLDIIGRRDAITQAAKTYKITELLSINDSFQYAKRNDCVNTKGYDYIRRLNTLYRQYAISEIKLQLAEILYDLKDYMNAAFEYEAAMDFHNAAACSLKAEREEEEIMRLLASAVLENPEDLDAFKLLFAYAGEKKTGAFLASTISQIDLAGPISTELKNIIYKGLIFVVSQYDEKTVNPYIGAASEKNILYILGLLKDTSTGEEFVPAKKSKKSLSLNANKAKVNLTDENYSDGGEKIFSGVITNFAKQYGTIDGRQDLKFSISQVENAALRHKLLMTQIKREKDFIKITYTFGTKINAKGIKIKTPDHIKPSEPLGSLFVLKGTIAEYIKSGSIGVILKEKKEYLFQENAIIDPYLQKYINDELKTSDLEVDFILDQKNYVKALWLTTSELNIKNIRERYAAIVPDKDKKHFKDKLEQIKSGLYFSKNIPQCPPYKELPPWFDIYESDDEILSPARELSPYTKYYKDKDETSSYDSPSIAEQHIDRAGIESAWKKIDELERYIKIAIEAKAKDIFLKTKVNDEDWFKLLKRCYRHSLKKKFNDEYYKKNISKNNLNGFIHSALHVMSLQDALLIIENKWRYFDKLFNGDKLHHWSPKFRICARARNSIHHNTANYLTKEELDMTKKYCGEIIDLVKREYVAKNEISRAANGASSSEDSQTNRQNRL